MIGLIVEAIVKVISIPVFLMELGSAFVKDLFRTYPQVVQEAQDQEAGQEEPQEEGQEKEA